MAGGVTVLPSSLNQRSNPAVGMDFALVFETHRAQIFRFLLSSLRDPDLAETFTQECFLRGFRAWGNYRGEANPLTWLTRIAVNLMRDHWRDKKLQFWRQTQAVAIDVDEASEWLAGPEHTPEEKALIRERIRAVWAAVDKLSARQRSIFLLRYVEEMELKEIAEATGLREGTVKTHLSRATLAVRQTLGRDHEARK